MLASFGETCTIYSFSASHSITPNFIDRNITIHVDKLHSSSPHIRIPEDAVAAIIASLPALQHVQINSLFLTDGRRYPYPPRDFEPIAQSLISRTRLCSIRISGQWPGGWTCPTALLGGAGEYARSFGMSISAIRDGAVCATLVGCAARLEHLDLSAAGNICGGIESEHFEMIAGALPFPQKLKSLKVFLRREKGRNWWQEPSFSRLTGLEDLDVRTTSTAADVDHSKDVLAMAFQVASELAVERDCVSHNTTTPHLVSYIDASFSDVPRLLSLAPSFKGTPNSRWALCIRYNLPTATHLHARGRVRRRTSSARSRRAASCTRGTPRRLGLLDARRIRASQQSPTSAVRCAGREACAGVGGGCCRSIGTRGWCAW